MAEKQPNIQGPPTICDVARVAGASIASVSRVLNGHGNARLVTRDRVLRAVAELLGRRATSAPTATPA